MISDFPGIFNINLLQNLSNRIKFCNLFNSITCLTTNPAKTIVHILALYLRIYKDK